MSARRPRRALGGRRRLAAWAPPAAWAGLIFFESSRDWPGLPGAGGDLGSWAGHLVLFGVLAALLHRAARIERAAPAVAVLAAFVATVLYGVSDEVHQAFVPGRSPSAADALVDAVGAAVALALVARARRREAGADDGGRRRGAGAGDRGCARGVSRESGRR